MRRLLCLTLTIGLLTGGAAAGTLSTNDQTLYRGLVPYAGVFGWAQQINQVAEGWEYYIDFYTSGEIDGAGYWIGGFDPTSVQNFADMPYVRDIWSYENFGRGTNFVMPGTVHVVDDYISAGGAGKYRVATHDGTVLHGGGSGTVQTDRMWIKNLSGWVGGMDPGLLMTWRFVLDEPVYDGNMWVAMSGQPEGLVFNLPAAPPPPAPGDVNEDGVIDADDIDLMGEAIRTGSAPTTANYDLSANGTTGGTDGSVSLADLDYLVRHLVETSAVDGGGNPVFGTQYGDFNLDGEIELGDLTRLGTYYGVGEKWSEGNANPHLDTDIELGDLTILGTYYGASNGGVDAIPEPMTMSLLALGGLAVLRRRSR